MRTTRSRSVPGSANCASDSASSAICQLCSAEFSKRPSPRVRVLRVTAFSLSSSSTKATTRASSASPGGAGVAFAPAGAFALAVMASAAAPDDVHALGRAERAAQQREQAGAGAGLLQQADRGRVHVVVLVAAAL